MGVIGFAVLFAGVISSTLAGASTSLLLAFILPVCLVGPPSSIPDRLAGWALASGVAFVAVALLWPAPARDPLRGPTIAACRAAARRLRSDVAFLLGGPGAPSAAEHDAVITADADAITLLRKGFTGTPYRPTGLGTSTRTLVRLIDELSWLNVIVVRSTIPAAHRGTVNRSACAVKVAAAKVLELSALLLEDPQAGPEEARAAVTRLREALATMELNAIGEPIGDRSAGEFVTSLDPSFRAQELAFAITLIAGNIDVSVAAERRSWLDRLLGHQPVGATGAWSAVQERAAAHIERHSVWLHNSLRGAVGLGAAVLVADLSAVQHSFWVVLGTLSVLRSNALSTGQNVVRGILGTVAGFVVGALLLAAIGTDTTVLWFLLPLAVLVAGVAPAAISFAAGQAAFTLTLVILFNIIAPAGWRVGLLRVEDIALGCGVSLVVGVLFWPRGATAALRVALSEAYAECARYLISAVEFGMLRCDAGAPAAAAPTGPAIRAAAASRRLDDTFRTYLAERGAKPIPLAEMTTLVTGVAGLRLTGDAVLDLWRRDDGRADGDRAAARREVLGSAEVIRRWYEHLAVALLGDSMPAAALAPDPSADARLVGAVRTDLSSGDGSTSATAIRMIWTGDHLEAGRRLQTGLVEPARHLHAARTGSTPARYPFLGRLIRADALKTGA